MRLGLAVALVSFALLFFELLLTRLFAVVLFSDLAHLTLAVAMLGTGIGALAQQRLQLVSAERLEERAAMLTVAQGVLTVLAVVCVCRFPLLTDSEGGGAATWFHRSALRFASLRWGWFALLVVVVSLPSVTAGATLAGVFQHRRAQFGRLYGADLVGAAVGALVVMPSVARLEGPDAVWLAALACGVGAAVLGRGRLRLVGAVSAVVALVLVAVTAATSWTSLSIRAPAAWGSLELVETRWTPMTRLARVQEGAREGILLDNASRSEVVTDAETLRGLMQMRNRGLAWEVGVEPGRVAILAAAAGPEVATALHNGFGPVDAFDIESETFSMVADRDDGPLNPYRNPQVRTVRIDARAAMMAAPDQHYRVIQLLNANLFGPAGRMSDAWSSSLLLTREALELYLNKVDEDGIISLSGLSATPWLPFTAAEVLTRRGVEEPYRHMALVGGGQEVFLLRPRPWTRTERDLLVRGLKGLPLVVDPLVTPRDLAQQIARLPDPFAGYNVGRPPLPPPAVLTDDHPYRDTPARAWLALRTGRYPEGMLYQTLVGQGVVVLVFGALVLGLPLAWRREREAVASSVPLMAYIACLGAGFLGVEIVLMAALTLFIGHPSVALVTVVTTLLLGSGLGSAWSHGLSDARAVPTLRKTLAAVLVFGALHAFVVSPWLRAHAITLPQAGRIALSALSVLPLGALMGTCFPLGLRGAPAVAVPWAWAVNGWASVAGGLLSLLVVRLSGYSAAMVAALAIYALALAVVWRRSASS